jgi:hypothetical protein
VTFLFSREIDATLPPIRLPCGVARLLVECGQMSLDGLSVGDAEVGV